MAKGGGGRWGGWGTCTGSFGAHFLAHEGEQVLDGQGIGALALDMGDGAIQALQAHQPPGCVVQAGGIPIQHQLLHKRARCEAWTQRSLPYRNTDPSFPVV